MPHDIQSRPSVVITGLGVLSPIGNGVAAYCDSLREGRSGVEDSTGSDARGHNMVPACEIKGFKPEQYFCRRELGRLDRASQLVLVATQEAMEDADLSRTGFSDMRAGLVLGTTHGGMVSGLRYYDAWRGGETRLKFLADFMPYSAADQVAIRYGIRGINLSISTACSTGANSLGSAYELIRYGTADVVIAGGFDTLCKLTGAGFGVLRCITDDRIRPFDRNRSGFSLGEGCGILVLEELEHARRRSARIYAELAGFGATADAYHMTAPHKDGCGLARAMLKAISDAGIDPTAVDYVNAHGTATRHNDRSETLAIKRVFGEHAYSLPVSSTKSMMGHTLGAAGSLEAIASVLAIQHGFIPPTINYETPDPECDLDYVANRSRSAKLNVVISNSCGFGGNNGTILFRRMETPS